MESDLVPEETEKELVYHLREKKVLGEGPRAWTIRYSALGGRGMFATRDIKQDELIYVDAPLLVGPRCVKKHLPMCVACYKNECPLFPCDRGCGLPVCSVECENSPNHVNYECEYLRKLVPTGGTDWSLDLLLAVTPIRALFLTDQQRRCLAAFQCHQVLSQGYELDLLRRNVKNLPTEEEMKLMKYVCGVFNTNSYETVSVENKDRSTSLRALYPMGALINHCCVPNTRHHFDGECRMYVSAALPISEGEEITITYTSLFWDTTLRRQFLKLTKYFSCGCKRCSDPTEFGSRLGALLCASDDCSGNLLPRDPLDTESPWVCDKCAQNVNPRQIKSIRAGLATIVEEDLYKTPRQMLKCMKEELADLVPPNYYLVTNMKFEIVSYFGRSEGLAWTDLTDRELATKRTYCNDLLAVMDTMNCGNCKKRGLILYELYCTNVEQLKRVQLQNSNNEGPKPPTQISVEENERLLEQAISILQNDIVAATLLEHDRKNLFN